MLFRKTRQTSRKTADYDWFSIYILQSQFSLFTLNNDFQIISTENFEASPHRIQCQFHFRLSMCFFFSFFVLSTINGCSMCVLFDLYYVWTWISVLIRIDWKAFRLCVTNEFSLSDNYALWQLSIVFYINEHLLVC